MRVSASSVAGSSAATERSKAATRAAMVLSGLFQRADKRTESWQGLITYP